jgi:hypothetical protein
VSKIVFLCDLEGVIFDNSHRLHLWKANLWDEYDDACLADHPHNTICEFLRSLTVLQEMIIVTGRSEKYRDRTLDQLQKLQIYPELVLFRPWYDIPKTKEAQIKLDFFNDTIKPMFGEDRIYIALEDRDDCVEAYRNAGIDCWQIRNGQLG